jgi:hypothetical protein
MIRVCRDARPAPILAKGGSPHVEATELDAYKLLVAHLLNFMNGAEIRGEAFEDGPYTKRQLARQKAQNLFHQAPENAIKTSAPDAANIPGRPNHLNLIGGRNG